MVLATMPAPAAPLPPPMEVDSHGYADAILRGDAPGLARSLHGALGPLRLDGFRAEGHAPTPGPAAAAIE